MRWRGHGAAAVIAAACLATPLAAQKLDATVAIGSSERMWSDALEEERRLLVYLPQSYSRTRQAYPVLYLLDGEAQYHAVTGIVDFLASKNARIPELIVVAITNTHRSRDLTPPSRDPHEMEVEAAAGHADGFLSFLADELVPWVNARYRVEPYRILVGHSYGGLFSLHALATRPESFQAYIAVSPALQWSGGEYVERTAQGVGSLSTPHALYLSWADNEPDIRDATRKLISQLDRQPHPSLSLSHHYYAGEDHGSTPLRAVYDGLLAIFAGWEMIFEVDGVARDFGLDVVEAHYARLSARYRFGVRPAPKAIDHVASLLLKNGRGSQALALFRRNAQEYPYIAAVHERLGDALEKLGRRDDALAAYRQASRVALEGEHPYSNPLDDLRRNTARLQGKP